MAHCTDEETAPTQAKAAAGSQLPASTSMVSHTEPSAVSLPDDVLIEIFSRVPSLARRAAAALPASRTEANADSQLELTGCSRCRRTVLPLVTRRWAQLLGGPGPPWTQVELLLGNDELPAALAWLQRRAAGIRCVSCTAHRSWLCGPS